MGLHYYDLYRLSRLELPMKLQQTVNCFSALPNIAKYFSVTLGGLYNLGTVEIAFGSDQCPTAGLEVGLCQHAAGNVLWKSTKL
jgi:hypothetical protein